MASIFFNLIDFSRHVIIRKIHYYVIRRKTKMAVRQMQHCCVISSGSVATQSAKIEINNAHEFLSKPNFAVIKNSVFSVCAYATKNRSYNFNPTSAVLDGICAIHLPEECYLLTVEHGNLGHFFHDQFFPLFKLWRKNPKKILAIICTSDQAATTIGANDNVIYDFIEATFGETNIIRGNPTIKYTMPSLIVPSEGRDLRKTFNYIKICREITKRCIRGLNIQENEQQRGKILLYPRLGLERKNLLGVDSAFLSVHGISLVELHSLSLRDQVLALMEAKVFIYIVGAGVFNLLFVHPDCKVLEINPFRNNSWAVKFGLSKICNFSLYISTNIQRSESVIQGDWRLDAHVLFDEQLQIHIAKHIQS